ncbi:MAG TPA: DNA translocase FtsK [Firmicutes bacterium]|nr:DNA translocase FtsK [Bacillota bacterium]
MALGLIAFVSLVCPPGDHEALVGRMGIAIATWLRLAFGQAAILVPPALAGGGILVLLARERPAMPRVVGLAVILIASSIILELEFARAIGSAFGLTGVTGGTLGAAGAAFLEPAVGEVGMAILAFLLLSLGVAATLDMSFLALCTWAWRALRGFSGLFIKAVFFSAAFLGRVLVKCVPGTLRERMSPRRAKPDLAGPAMAETACAGTSPVIVDPAADFATGAGSKPGMPHAPAGEGSRRKPRSETPSQALSQAPGESPTRPPIVISDSSGGYVLPPISLLKDHTPKRSTLSSRDAQNVIERAKLLEETLRSFGVDAKVVQVNRGPVVTRYEVQPGPGVKVSKIVNLSDDISLALAAVGVRVEAPIPGKSAVGIEVPNSEIAMVYFRSVLESPEFRAKNRRLPIAIGKDIAGTPVVADLVSMLHLLVAGATGSGKSVCLNALISSLLFTRTPDEVKLLMIDPKRVELTTYDGVPHLLAPVVTDTKEAAGYLRWVAGEMDKRYRLLEEAGVRNIDKYNEACIRGRLENPEATPLPYIVVIIDELGDLMMVAQKDVEDVVCQLAFMARAAGIHLVVATQRPSADVITGVIKMNIPSRIAFAVPSQVDSRVILDSSGAERLLGKGDMLFFPVGALKPVRVQGAYISDAEVEDLVEYVKSQASPNYEAVSVAKPQESDEERGIEDELFDEAVRVVLETQEASVSRLQRRLRIGYNRAASLIDAMELKGIVGPPQGSKPRKVLISPDRWGSGSRR